MKTALFVVITLVVCSVSRRSGDSKDKKVFSDNGGNDNTVTTKKENGADPAKRQFCTVKFNVKENGDLVMQENLVIKNKYLVGKFTIMGEVSQQGDNHECDVLDLNKCYNENKEQLTRSAFLRASNGEKNTLRLSFNFLLGVSPEANLCYVSVAQKTGNNEYTPQEQVMQYSLDSSLYKQPDQYLNLHDMIQPQPKKLTLEESLKKCSDVMTKSLTDNTFVSDFYKTFEGFLLSRVMNQYVTLRCRKMTRSKEALFRTVNSENQKKVDVFYNNEAYTHIMFRDNSAAIAPIEVTDAQKGFNLGTMKLFSVDAKAFTPAAYLANHCYDMDRKNLQKSLVKGVFVPDVTDNNVQFSFQVGIKAEEDKPQGKIGTHCAIYSVSEREEGSDKKYYVQNDMVMKFKPTDGLPVTDENCSKTLLRFADSKSLPLVNIYFLKDSRTLAGAVLNGIVNRQARLYCSKDFLSEGVRAIYLTELKQKMFYHEAQVDLQTWIRDQEGSQDSYSEAMKTVEERLNSFKENESSMTFPNKMAPFDEPQTSKDSKQPKKDDNQVENKDENKVENKDENKDEKPQAKGRRRLKKRKGKNEDEGIEEHDNEENVSEEKVNEDKSSKPLQQNEGSTQEVKAKGMGEVEAKEITNDIANTMDDEEKYMKSLSPEERKKLAMQNENDIKKQLELNEQADEDGDDTSKEDNDNGSSGSSINAN